MADVDPEECRRAAAAVREATVALNAALGWASRVGAKVEVDVFRGMKLNGADLVMLNVSVWVPA